MRGCENCFYCVRRRGGEYYECRLNGPTVHPDRLHAHFPTLSSIDMEHGCGKFEHKDNFVPATSGCEVSR